MMIDTYFDRVLHRDLVPHQDHVLHVGPATVLLACRDVVTWHAANDADNNVLEPDEVAPFLAWFDAHRHANLTRVQEAYFS